MAHGLGLAEDHGRPAPVKAWSTVDQGATWEGRHQPPTAHGELTADRKARTTQAGSKAAMRASGGTNFGFAWVEQPMYTQVIYCWSAGHRRQGSMTTWTSRMPSRRSWTPFRGRRPTGTTPKPMQEEPDDLESLVSVERIPRRCADDGHPNRLRAGP